MFFTACCSCIDGAGVYRTQDFVASFGVLGKPRLNRVHFFLEVGEFPVCSCLPYRTGRIVPIMSKRVLGSAERILGESSLYISQMCPAAKYHDCCTLTSVFTVLTTTGMARHQTNPRGGQRPSKRGITQSAGPRCSSRLRGPPSTHAAGGSTGEC